MLLLHLLHLPILRFGRQIEPPQQNLIRLAHLSVVYCTVAMQGTIGDTRSMIKQLRVLASYATGECIVTMRGEDNPSLVQHSKEALKARSSKATAVLLRSSGLFS